MTSGIYKLTFENGQYYIGKSDNIQQRWDTHAKNFIKGTHTKKMQLAYDRHGPPDYEVLLPVHQDHVDIYEGILIQQHWGDQLLNTTRPKLIDPQLAKRYLDAYDSVKIQDQSCMMYSTITHVDGLVQLQRELDQAAETIADLEQQLEDLECEGVVLPHETKQRLEELEDQQHKAQQQITQLTQQLQRWETMTWWQRLWNFTP